MNATAQVTRNGGKKDSQVQKRKLEKWLIIGGFLLVPMVLLILFTYVPLLDMFRFSFLKWDGISKENKTFVGLANYIEVFTRPEYLEVLATSIYYFIGSVIQIVLA